MTSRQVLAAAAVITALLAGATSASAAIIVVSPTDASGWSAVSTACAGAITSTQGFVAGPPPAPEGSGSRSLKVGDNEGSAEQYRQSGFSGTPLNTLSVLNYFAYVTSPLAIPPPGTVPYLALAIDENGDGDFADATDEYIVYEPSRQGDLVLNGIWQQWRALNGMWRHGNDTAPSPTLFPLLTGTGNYSAMHTSAQIFNDAATGGVILGAGCKAGEIYGGGPFAGTWAGFDGNVDSFSIKTFAMPETTTYDFEPGEETPPGQPPGPTPQPGPTPGPPGTADLSIAKTGTPDPVGVGETLTYNIAVANFGPGAASATVKDTLPSSVDFVSATPSKGSCSGTQVVTCELGEMARDTSASIRIAVKTTVTGTLENSATVSSSTTDSFMGNNSVRVSTKVADRRAPRVVLGGPRRCTLFGDRPCRVDVQSDERGRATLTGTVSFKGAAASARFAIRRASRGVAAGRRHSIRLRVSRRARRAVRRALTNRKRVRARVRVVVKDSAGNARTVRRRLRIVG